jgi:protein O-mannosyl-transferase
VRRVSTGIRKAPPLLIWEEPWLRALFLVAFVFLAYSRVFHAEFIWDDDHHLTSPALGSLGGLGRIWSEPGSRQQYYPLIHTMFWVEYKIWGYAPLPYHFVNILLHAGAALLIWRILQTLKIPGAWLAAGIFALHPVEVESVAWVSELKNTLSGVLFLGAVLVYLRFDQVRSRSLYFGALGLFALGLFSKTAIAPLPVVLLAVFWWQRGKISWQRDVIPLVPFFAVAIPLGLLTAWVEQKFVGAKGDAFDFGLVERCLIAGRAFWFYLGKLFWPVDLIFMYPRWEISSSVWWQYLFPAAALLLFVVLLALQKRWRGPLAGMLIFALMLFPALGFFNVYPFIYSFVADHFQYLASVAVIALVAAGATLSAKKLSPNLRLVLSLALLGVLAALTWQQSGIYADRETLYRSILAKNAGSWMAHNNLAIVLEEKGKTPEAVTHYERAVEIYPRYVQARNNLAWILATSPDASLRNGTRAVELAGQADRFSGGDNKLVLRTLAAAYAEAAQFGKAIENARAALQLARKEGDTDLATELEREITFYERGKPYRETPEAAR